MKFRAKPVNDLTDITLDLEQLETRDILDQSSTTILQLAVTGTKRKVAVGSTTFTFAGGTPVSGVNTVTHGLGATPVVVIMQNADPAAAAFLDCWVSAVSSTTFTTKAFNTAAVNQGASSFPFYWLAVG